MNQFSFLQSLGWALLNSLWQMAILWLLFQLFITVFKNTNAAKKSSAAILATITGFAWFVFTFLKYLFFEMNPLQVALIQGIANEQKINTLAGKILPVVTIIYLIVLILPVIQFIRNYRYVLFIRNSGLKKIDAGWRMFVKNTSHALGIMKSVSIWVSDHVLSPVTVGYLKPVILIPVAAINNLTPHQLEAVILHELSHIHRNDYFFNLVISFIKTILYFNPFVKLLVKSIEKERELSCDEMVLQFRYKPSEYASALLRIEQNNRRQMVLAATGKNHDLLHRIEAILGIERKQGRPFRKFAFAMFTLFSIGLLQVFVTVKDAPSKEMYSLNSYFSPYYLLNSKPAISNNQDITSYRHSSNTKIKDKTEEPYFSLEPSALDVPSFYNVNYTTPVMPELSPEAEETVKATIEATKKILKEQEWKTVEKNFAEVFNTDEKKLLKNEYQKKVETTDWNKLESQLRLSYENINWEKVNKQVYESLATIKLDSIQHQLHISLNDLACLEKLLKENKINSVPDTDISLEKINAAQHKARQQLDKIKSTEKKKVVRI